MKNLINHYSLTIYFLLAFIISWGLIVSLAGTGNIPINAEKSQDLLPLLYVSMLFGPSVAGILMIGLTDGKSGFKGLVSRLFKWRVNIKWYLLAMFATPLLAVLVLLVLSFVLADFQFGFPQSDNTAGLILNGIIIGIMVGLFEELGWTGFVTPRLIQRHSILVSGIVVGIIWGGWHYILFWEKDSFSGALPFFILIGRLFGWLPPFRVFMMWIYNRTGSMLLTILTHTSLVFTTTVVIPMTVTGKNLLIWLLAWSVTLWIAIFIINTKTKNIET